jgi:hypothetical protein
VSRFAHLHDVAVAFIIGFETRMRQSHSHNLSSLL